LQAKKYLEVLDQLPKLKGIVVWNVDSFAEKPHDIVMTWKEFLELGDRDSGRNRSYADVVNERIERQVPGMCCNIVYTSGTTGNPKGVMLTHDNMFFVIAQVLREWEDQGIEDGRERVVSYLPLSHSAAQVVDLLNNLVARTQIYFARPDALQGSLVETLTHARPTMFLGVPRVWEKMEERLKELASQSPSLLQKISGWAKGKGALSSDARLHSKPTPFGYSLAHFLILGRVKKALGLDQTKVLLVSAAPMKPSTFEYFKSLDMPIINVYGMTESTAPETTAKPGKFKDNTVGYAIAETDIKIDKRDRTEGGLENEGEVCFRGRNNFIGYLNNEQNTRETLDKDGYIHSGDIGTKDDEGFVRITGRIKELIITAGGENVAPVLIEDSLKSICPIISNVMVIGDDKKYLSALITFKVDVDNSTGMNTPTKNLTPIVKKFLVEELGVKDVNTSEEATKNEAIMKYLQEKIDENNKIAISRAQHIRKFRVIPTDFSMESDELTPTLKLKRRVVLEKYNDLIAEMYPEDVPDAKM
jgi:long-chain-fatty-acid--CoA ligase ACSBG